MLTIFYHPCSVKSSVLQIKETLHSNIIPAGKNPAALRLPQQPERSFPAGTSRSITLTALRGDPPASCISSRKMPLTQEVLGCRCDVQLEAIFVRRGPSKMLRPARRAWCVEHSQGNEALADVVAVIWMSHYLQ